MRRPLVILWVLYFVQGLPYGFQAIALPAFLRAEGMSLAGIGLASALSLPWMLKLIWGPAVDRFGHRHFGRRKSWIVPLQAGLLVCCAAMAFTPPSSGLQGLLAMVFLINLFAATMDVAVDGLAVDSLRPEELGYGNIAQVVGYKLGMLTGGGLLVWASDQIGWRGIFFAMASLVALALTVTLAYREPAAERGRRMPASMGEIVSRLLAAVRLPGSGWLLLFVGTYKLGEAMADTMFRPFLVDAGYRASDLGLWLGTWGLGFSLVGSIAGGMLASRMPFLRAVAIAAALRALAVGGEWWLSLVAPTTARMAAVVAAESLFGGALTTALFAYMMSRVDRRIGASHFTLLATVEVGGKLLAAQVSGVLAERLGYSGLFALATVLAIAFLGLLRPLVRADGGAPQQAR